MEDNFTNRIRELLQKRPEPSFREQDWQALRQRLPLPSPTSPGLHWGWVATPLLLLLLASNVWWYGLMKRTDTLVTDQQNTRDRIQIVYRTDTIYLRDLAVAGGQHPSSLNQARIVQSYLSYPLAMSRYPFAPQPGQADTWPAFERHRLQSIGYRWPAMPVLSPPALPKEPTDPAQPPAKRTYYTNRLRLDALTLGLQLGGTFTQHDAYTSAPGYLLAPQLSGRLSDYLRLWTEAAYLRTIYETDQLGKGLPEKQPPLDGMEFDEVEISQPSLLFTLGLTYDFPTENRLEPFVSLGYSLLQPLSNELIYDFIDPLSQQKIQFEHSGSASPLQANYILLQAGFRYPLSRRWSWQMQLNHRARWFQHGHQLFGVQTGLHYRLKK